MNGIDNGLLIAIFVAVIGQSTVLWWKLGRVETGLVGVMREQGRVATSLIESRKQGCPFPACPVFKRAMDEAAPIRE